MTPKENRIACAVKPERGTHLKLEQSTGATITQLWTTVEPSVQLARSLEEAAQALATTLYNQFAESAILARVFVTVPFAALPPLTQPAQPLTKGCD